MKLLIGLFFINLFFSFSLEDENTLHSKPIEAKSSVRPPNDCTNPATNFEKVL